MAPEVTKKLAAASAPGSGATAELLIGKPLNSSGDKTNLVEFWRNPDSGEIYRHAEHNTFPIASCLVQYAKLPETVITATKPLEVMDIACGTGSVSSYIQTLMKEMKPAEREKVRLMSSDSSEALLRIVQEKIAMEGWLGSKVVQSDIMIMSFPSDTFDFVMVANALMLVADPYTSLDVECYRVIKPGGTLATSTWVTEGWVPDTRDAVASLGLPGQPPVSWPQSSMELTSLWGPGAWHSPTFLKSMFRAAGFVDIKVEIVTNCVPFSSANQWCTVFQAFMQGVLERFWTKEQRDKLKGKLMPTIKAFLEKRYQRKPLENKRTILLVRGRKPEH
ncbi:S-adenosyl-L-methionine-dependent methyltransferase [Colletotrichum caudatum]|nr:S-adenosyl-L-methionine-dependent methyltransferase [Colletotrichum caudatum]